MKKQQNQQTILPPWAKELFDLEKDIKEENGNAN